MKRIIAGIAGILFATMVQGAELNLSWTNATQNMDGSAIPTDTTNPSSLVTTELAWGVCDANNMPSGTIDFITVPTTVPGNAESATITVDPGTWCVYARHKNLGGVYSDYSPSVVKTVLDEPVTPEPPQTLTVTGTTVFTILKQNNRFILLPVGTVPGDTACDPTQYVNGHYVVPRSAVTWSSDTVRPVVVVAKCG